MPRWTKNPCWWVVSVSLLGLPATARTAESPVPLKWKAFDPVYTGHFYQTFTTKTTQTMKVMGMDVKQEQQQIFYIKWTPEPPAEGNWIVRQRIIGMQIDIDIGGNKISYDSTPFQTLLEFDLKFTIDKDLNVVKIEGSDEFVRRLSESNPQMEPSFKEFLSGQALKKMTRPTLFAFPPSSAKRWKKQSILDLGPIGAFHTDYFFTRAGRNPRGQEKIEIRTTMVYSNPSKKGILPFTNEKVELTGKDGRGYALFNLRRGWFDFYTMKMTLQGKLSIEIGGMKTDVDLNQKQTTTIRTTTYNPLAVPLHIERQGESREVWESCSTLFRQRCHLFPRVVRRCRR